MRIEGSVALVTGASRGIGRELLGALLAAGAKKVYAGARDPRAVDAHGGRVTPLELDITDARHVARAAEVAGDVNLLINNAGLLSAFNLLTTPPEAVEREFATNFYGPLAMTRAMLPAIERAGGGAIANLLTVVSLASMPGLCGYSATKAAAWSLTYYLAQRQLSGLQRYFKEVSRMPRDLELDDKVLLGAFARAFDCVDARKNVDQTKLADLARQWMNFSKSQTLEASAIHKKIQEFYDKMKKPEGGDKPVGRPQPPGGGGNP